MTLPLSRSAECESCGEDLRVCKNCEFFDVTASQQCREPMVDLVQEKERSNWCDHFVLNQKQPGSAGSDPKQDLLAAAEALFKKK